MTNKDWRILKDMCNAIGGVSFKYLHKQFKEIVEELALINVDFSIFLDRAVSDKRQAVIEDST